MKIIFLIVVIYVSAIKLNDHKPSKSLQPFDQEPEMIGEFLSLTKRHPLAKMAIEFAQVNLKALGVVDTLIEVLQAFGRQLEDKLKTEKEIFDSLLGEHTSKVLFLESLVNQAELDINRERKRLNQELIPRSADLDDILTSLKIKKEDNKQSISVATATRKEQNFAFTRFTNEITEATRAVDEALQSIKELTEKSLLQINSDDQRGIVKKLKTIKHRAEKVGKFFGSFLEALSEVTEQQNFSDRQVIKELVDLLNSLRGNFIETLQKAYADEEQQNLNHQLRMKQLDEEAQVFSKQYAENLQEREEKSSLIHDTENLITTRTQEHQGYVDRLTTENNNFASSQKIQDDFSASLNDEIGIIEKVIDFLSQPQILDYLQTEIKKQE